MGSEKRLYVLDTNVLMHDPTAIFRFEEHDVFLPMMVLEELDAAKKGLSEVARNVRQVSRFIGEMMQRQQASRLDEGLELREPDGLELSAGTGRLYFQTAMPETHSSLLRDGSFADNEILSTALALQDTYSEKSIVLVSKDINLRIKAAILGVQAEDYYNDRALDDLSLLYRGLRVHDEGFWEINPHIESWNEGSLTHYRIPIGNPVRREISELEDPATRMAGRSGRLRLLVFGGSRGSRSINSTPRPAISTAIPPTGVR